MPALGLPWTGGFDVVDLLSGEGYHWHQRIRGRAGAADQGRPTSCTSKTGRGISSVRDLDTAVGMGMGSAGHAAPAPESSAADFPHARRMEPSPGWYKRAVFYEVLVRAFYDSNADGTGDLRGLVEKLDYLEWLGVDCLWLPPFYSSPLRDGGYDIADFRSVLPEFGTVTDFVAFLDAAHGAASGSSPTW